MTKKEAFQKHLTRIVALATEIEESPSMMGWEDIERLAELHEEASKALALLPHRGVNF